MGLGLGCHQGGVVGGWVWGWGVIKGGVVGGWVDGFGVGVSSRVRLRFLSLSHKTMISSQVFIIALGLQSH